VQQHAQQREGAQAVLLIIEKATHQAIAAGSLSDITIK
jgi:hypothetical protein